MGRQSFASVDGPEVSPASHTAVANTVTRTNLWSPSRWTPIAATDLKPGKAYHLRAGGIVSTTGTPTLIVNPTFGASGVPGSNTALGASPTIALGSGLASAPWFAEFVLAVRSLGLAAAGATITGNGVFWVGGPAATAGQAFVLGGTVVTNADDSIAQGLCLDVTWGAASVSNTITCQWQLLASLN
jgi:hypothetical protein